MREMDCIATKPDGTSTHLRIRIADTFCSRLRGLMGAKRLPRGEGLLLAPCNAIHMLFMRFAIDALFLDREGRVLKVATLFPWRGLSLCRSAHAVLELPAGEARRLGIETDDAVFQNGKEGARCLF